MVFLARFTDMIIRAAAANKPSVIARYVVDVVAEFNKFYHQCPVLQAEPSCNARAWLLLMPSDRYWLTDCGFCGIAAPEEM